MSQKDLKEKGWEPNETHQPMVTDARGARATPRQDTEFDGMYTPVIGGDSDWAQRQRAEDQRFDTVYAGESAAKAARRRQRLYD